METEPFPGATLTPVPEYKPRDEKSMVDDYLRGVGMPRNNRRVEQMLGIGY